METFQLAEKTFAAHMVNGDNPELDGGLQAGELVLALGCGELQQKEAEARLFHCCQSTSVETVTELTEFAKAVPGFQSLDLNDQVSAGMLCLVFCCFFKIYVRAFVPLFLDRTAEKWTGNWGKREGMTCSKRPQV